MPGTPLSRLIDEGVDALRRNEAALRAALRLSLGEWPRGQPSSVASDRPISRGGRIALLEAALGQDELDELERRRLVMGLSLVFGIEGWIVMKDIWRVDDETAKDVILWAARAIARAAGISSD